MQKHSIIIGFCLIGAVFMAATAQQRRHDDIMKEVGATFASLRKNLDEKKASEAAADAAKLEDLFRQTEDFWAPFKTKDATGFAKDARAAAARVAEVAKAGDLAAASTAYGGIGKNCKGCHDSHREQMPDKTYRIKP